MLAGYLKRILIWADVHVPGLRRSLRAGASAELLRSVEDPSDVHELYRLYDGQDCSSVLVRGLVYGLPLLPIEEAREEWASWQRLLETDPDLDEDCAEFMTSLPPGAIEPHYIYRGWFPLTSDGYGNHLGVDLLPGPTGTRGQVILFGRNEDEKLLVAHSVTDFLGWYAAELEHGNFIVELDDDEDPPIAQHFGIGTPALHFHDAARALRRERGPFGSS